MVDKDSKKFLIEIAKDLRKLVNSLNALVNVTKDLGKLAESLTAFIDVLIVDSPCEKVTLPEAEQPTAIESAEDQEKRKAKLILEARAILGTKVTSEAQELIRSYGVQHLSKVDLADFDELITKAKELTDAPK